MRFADRSDAGRQLAERVAQLPGLIEARPIVLGLPRGGVPVAAEVARALDAPLDALVVRKLGCPWQPELGVGAVAEGGTIVTDPGLMADLGLDAREMGPVIDRERAELDRRVRRYRGDRPPMDVEGRTVVIVDDGLATGGTTRAAIAAARARGAAGVVLAVPVAPAETVAALRGVVDAVVVVTTPEWMTAIGEAYDDFRQVDDAEVEALLTRPVRDAAR